MKAYSGGYRAYCEGDRPNENPYILRWRKRAWVQGFIDARIAVLTKRNLP